MWESSTSPCTSTTSMRLATALSPRRPPAPARSRIRRREQLAVHGRALGRDHRARELSLGPGLADDDAPVATTSTERRRPTIRRGGGGERSMIKVMWLIKRADLVD